MIAYELKQPFYMERNLRHKYYSPAADDPYGSSDELFSDEDEDEDEIMAHLTIQKRRAERKAQDKREQREYFDAGGYRRLGEIIQRTIFSVLSEKQLIFPIMSELWMAEQLP